MKYKNLTVIGTSHIATQSIEAIRASFADAQPVAVALELDRARLHSLLENKQTSKLRMSDVKALGVGGFLFAWFGSYVQKKLGNQVGVSPGSDMLAALTLARKHKLPVHLVDQDVRVTLRRLSKAITFREIMRFIGDMFSGLLFKKNDLKKYGIEKLDLSKVPEQDLIDKMTLELKKKYPSLHKVLIEERNEYMASRLARLIHIYLDKPVLAVVGAGHEKDLITLIRKKEKMIEVVGER